MPDQHDAAHEDFKLPVGCDGRLADERDGRGEVVADASASPAATPAAARGHRSGWYWRLWWWVGYQGPFQFTWWWRAGHGRHRLGEFLVAAEKLVAQAALVLLIVELLR